MAHKKKDNIKVSGYAKRVFFNSNIEYRDFSDNLVGLQLASDGGTPLFTMGNFSITTNLSPKISKIFKQGAYSPFYTLNTLGEDTIENINIQKSQKLRLNLDITDPLSYVWYGSSSELIRVSLEYIHNYFPAAIYVDNKVGSVTGNNITNYSYDSVKDQTTFIVNSSYFNNPYNIKYTKDAGLLGTEEEVNPLRNLITKYKYYTITHSGITKNIIDFSGSVKTTNANVLITVEGNPFPELTGINFSQFSFLNPLLSGSIPFFIKPNENTIDAFFASLNNLEYNLLNRGTHPIYTSTFNSPEQTDDGVTVYTQKTLTFPLLNDGYNLNFFDSLYITYLDEINKIGVDLDETKTDLIKRKYTAAVITGFDTIPRGDGENLVLDGAKATKLLRIYGVAFDNVKKYINGIKFAHIVTYNKKDNTPDKLIKELADMLGLYTQFGMSRSGGNQLPFFTDINLDQLDVVLFRRLILNVAWLWKSKGARKAIEFLFRFIGGPELIVTFDEHIVIADKPVDIHKLKKLLYLYTGSSNISFLPFDDDGYPLPLKDGEYALLGFNTTITSATTTGNTGTTLTTTYSPIIDQLWFQKGGGWYRETGGLNPPIDINTGNNPHVGPYDGGALYLQQFTNCPIPGFSESVGIVISGVTLHENHFINYNHGFVNGIASDSDLYITLVSGTNNQIIDECFDIELNIINAPRLSGGTSVYEKLCLEAIAEYHQWVTLINENCELVYSPEWYNVYNNYITATLNYSQELISANCAINQSLEICLSHKPPIITNPCDNYTPQFLENGMIIFIDSEGAEVTFDEYVQCCKGVGGGYYTSTYLSTYPGGGDLHPPDPAEIYFCAYEDPCSSEEMGVTAEGYVIWEMLGNTLPDNTYLLSVDGKPKCYQKGVPNLAILPVIYGLIGFDPEADPIAFDQWVTDPNNIQAIKGIIGMGYLIEIDCALTNASIMTTKECCTYHGYQWTYVPQPVDNGDGTTGVEWVIACVNYKGVIIGDDQGVHLTQTPGNTDYTQYSNLNAPLTSNSLATSNSLGTYQSATSNPGSTNTTDFGAAYGGPYYGESDLYNCNDWEVASVDEYGRITFKPVIPSDDNLNLTIDWTTTDQTSFYVNCCLAKGYTYTQFLVHNTSDNTTLYSQGPVIANTEIHIPPLIGEGATNSNYVYACVDETHIDCDEIDDVKLILGSNGMAGFYLPEPDDEGDCGCDINIRFDFMVKYDPAALIECACDPPCMCEVPVHGGQGGGLINIGAVTATATTLTVLANTGAGSSSGTAGSSAGSGGGGIAATTGISLSAATAQPVVPNIPTGLPVTSAPCIPAIFNEGTLDNIRCKDFIVFVTTQEESDDLIANPPPGADSVVVWQENVLQVEPAAECCELLGGTIREVWGNATSQPEWNAYHNNQWSLIIDEYDLINNDPLASSHTTPQFLTFQDEFEDVIVENLNKILGQACLTNFFPTSPEVPCNINYSDYITTSTICSIIPPMECGLLSVLLFKASIRLEMAYEMQTYLDNCVLSGYTWNKMMQITDRQIISAQVNISITKEDRGDAYSEIDNEIESLQWEIYNVNVEINENNTQNIAISTVIADNDPDLQCNVYDARIAEIDQFDKEYYCKKNTPPDDNLQVYDRAYKQCISNQTQELALERSEYVILLGACQKANAASKAITEAISAGDTPTKNSNLTTYNDSLTLIQTTTKSCCRASAPLIDVNNYTTIIGNDINGNINIAANLLDVNPDSLRNNNIIRLTAPQKVELQRINLTNTAKNSELYENNKEIQQQLDVLNGNRNKISEEIDKELSDLQNILTDIEGNKQTLMDIVKSNSPSLVDCCTEQLSSLLLTITTLEQLISDVTTATQDCYDNWNSLMVSNYENYINSLCESYLSFIDDLKINFTLEVDNNVVGTIPPSALHYNLTALPVTNNINPIWEFNKQNYSGVIIEGADAPEVVVKDSISIELINDGYTGLNNIFEPQWQTFEFHLTPALCEAYKKCYPDKQFFIGIELEDVECDLCLLLDNVQINFDTCKRETLYSTETCPLPELKCVVDNRKSWVYSDKGISYVPSTHDGSCVAAEIDCEEIAGVHSTYLSVLQTPLNRLWLNLEYRYTEYDYNHSDLIINTKSAAFKIDPAKTIECDVYNFWSQINCDECPTSCDLSCYLLTEPEPELYIATESGCTLLVWCDIVGDFIQYNGVIRSTPSAPLTSYTLTLTAGCTDLIFSCDTYTTLLEEKVVELKDEYYALTGNYNAALSATYSDLKKLGGNLNNFGITKNNCGTDSIILGNYKDVNELFGLLTEDIDGTLSLFEIYVYNGGTPYSGGTHSVILSGYTAQTFDLSIDINKECCKSINSLLNDTGKYGMGLGKNYVWDGRYSACTWTDLDKFDNCQGDCSYFGSTIVNKYDNPHDAPPYSGTGSYCPCEWEDISKPIGNHTGLSFINNSTGWVCDYESKVHKTTDGAQSWTTTTNGLTGNTPLWDIQFIDELTGYTCGSRYVYKTIDGGISWMDTTNGIATSASGNISNVFFLNENEGWAGVGTSISGQPHLYRTNDAGASWIQLTAATTVAMAYVSTPPFSPRIFNGIYFRNSAEGKIVSQNSILSTSDSGNTWTVDSGPIGIISFAFLGGAIEFIDDNRGWVGSLGGVYYITGWTGTWTLSPIPGAFINDISFPDSNNGVAVGGVGDTYRTTDGGINWFPECPLGTTNVLEQVQMFSETTGFAAGWGSTFSPTIIFSGDVGTILEYECSSVHYHGPIPNNCILEDIVVSGISVTTATTVTTGYTAGYCIAPYSATPAGDYCEYVVSSGATYTGIDFTAYTGNIDVAYGVNGTRWYDLDFQTASLPYNLQGTSTTLLNNLGNPVPIKALNTTEPLWDNIGGTDGRLNKCGIWATPPPSPASNPPFNTWLGFSQCINIINPGIYCIGLAADNRTRFYLDGNPMFTSSAVTFNTTADLSVWRIFEMNLTSGEHIIAMEGLNDFDQAAFGAEIYSATTAQLTGMTTESQLSAVTIFTTADYRSDVFGDVRLFDFGSSSTTNFGYSCPAGWTFASTPCYLSATCVDILSTELIYDITGATGTTAVSGFSSTTLTLTSCTEYDIFNICGKCYEFLPRAEITQSTDEVECMTVITAGTYTHGCQLPASTIYVTSDGDVLYNTTGGFSSFEFHVSPTTITGVTGVDYLGPFTFNNEGVTGGTSPCSVPCTALGGGCGTLLNISATTPLTNILWSFMYAPTTSTGFADCILCVPFLGDFTTYLPTSATTTGTSTTCMVVSATTTCGELIGSDIPINTYMDSNGDYYQLTDISLSSNKILEYTPQCSDSEVVIAYWNSGSDAAFAEWMADPINLFHILYAVEIGCLKLVSITNLNQWAFNNYCNSEFNTCFNEVECCEVKEINICVNPIEFLDTPPDKIQVKAVFDEMVERNLIDVKNRQTINAYPTLQLFYYLYLNASNCGKDLTGKLTYNNLFQFMNLIGDYWLELIEQVIPATTIMEGCDNSGKVYRNTIFDRNKFVYKKYALNYTDCCVSKAAPTAMGCKDVDIKVEELCLQGDCLGHEYKACKVEEQSLVTTIAYLQEQITFINNQLQLPTDGDITSPCSLTDAEIQRLQDLINVYKAQLIVAQQDLINKTIECDELLIELTHQQQLFAQQKADCKPISDQIFSAQTKLDLMLVGSSTYNLQVDYINELTQKYEKCIRLASTLTSNYNSLFITQFYNTNEYEGRVTVYGNDEWNSNTELIHDLDCDEEVIVPEDPPTQACGRDKCIFTVPACSINHNELLYLEGTPQIWRSPSSLFDCICTATTASTIGVTYITVNSGPILAPFLGDFRSWGYQLNLPSIAGGDNTDAQILGVMVRVRRMQDTQAQWRFSGETVQLMYGGNTIGDPLSLFIGSALWDTNFDYATFGGTTDLSGHQWSVTEINSPSFGVSLMPQVDGLAGAGPNTGYIDCISVWVRYYYDENA